MTDHNEVAMLEALQEMLQRKFGKQLLRYIKIYTILLSY